MLISRSHSPTPDRVVAAAAGMSSWMLMASWVLQAGAFSPAMAPGGATAGVSCWVVGVAGRPLAWSPGRSGILAETACSAGQVFTRETK